MARIVLLSVCGLAFVAVVASGQNRITSGAPKKLFNEHCASCHGEDLNGGMGGSLLKDEWTQLEESQSFIEYVQDGNEEMGMPPFEEALSEKQIRSLEIYIDEVARKTEREERPVVDKSDGLYSAGGYEFKLETVVDGLSVPWAIAFLPEGGYLITERSGALRIYRDGRLQEPVEGVPDVWQHGQGGLLEVALHPEYEENGWVYLGYSEKSETSKGRARGITKVVRGRIDDNTWRDEEALFEAPDEYHSSSGVHYGTRFVFKDGYLFFSIGDRGAKAQAQDKTRPNGKIHRIFVDGRTPEDNPFADEEDAYPTIWTYGNRNPQGLDKHPQTGEIWASEHGPRGGDEINLIEKGNNYGWPVITYGMNYNGTPITEKTSAPGMEQPAHYWTPSIAVCGMDFYEGDIFPEWKNNLMVGGLASQELHRLVIEGDAVVEDEIILEGEGRVRDVASGPDGHLYVVLNGPGRVVRLVPGSLSD
ncbi:MAG: PQQ-dependent sugar dehydrogenase [Opitutales bacterium]